MKEKNEKDKGRKGEERKIGKKEGNWDCYKERDRQKQNKEVMT